MKPGEILYGSGDIEINAGAEGIEMHIVNTGDRPIQVGSHAHLPQANAALSFDRAPPVAVAWISRRPPRSALSREWPAPSASSHWADGAWCPA